MLWENKVHSKYFTEGSLTNLVHRGTVCQEKEIPCDVIPSASELETASGNVKRIRRKAKHSNEIWDMRYIQRRMQNDPPSVYGVGEKIVLRYPTKTKGRIAPKKRYVLEATVLRRKPQTGKYFIGYISPTTNERCEEWVSVEAITSTTASAEKEEEPCSESLENV